MVLKDHNVEVGSFFVTTATIVLGFQLQILVLNLHQIINLLLHKNVSWQVLSELLADLDACDSQKGDTNVLANCEVAHG